MSQSEQAVLLTGTKYLTMPQFSSTFKTQIIIITIGWKKQLRSGNISHDTNITFNTHSEYLREPTCYALLAYENNNI